MLYLTILSLVFSHFLKRHWLRFIASAFVYSFLVWKFIFLFFFSSSKLTPNISSIFTDFRANFIVIPTQKFLVCNNAKNPFSYFSPFFSHEPFFFMPRSCFSIKDKTRKKYIQMSLEITEKCSVREFILSGHRRFKYSWIYFLSIRL